MCLKQSFFFENILLLSVSRNSFQTPSSDDILAGNYMVKLNHVSRRPNKMKRTFEILLIGNIMRVILEIKNISCT